MDYKLIKSDNRNLFLFSDNKLRIGYTAISKMD